MHEMKEKKGVKLDTDLTADDLKKLAAQFKARVLKVLGKPFPDEPMDQLWGSVSAVFQSWNGRRAVEYRRIEKIPDEWGTAVTVQTMVFGNMGETSATGVGFTRDPATGRNIFYGEWLPNAQGEDVVAGIRTPLPVNEAGKTAHTKGLTSLEKAMPAAYKQLNAIQQKLEKHYHDMLDIEFTIEEGRLFMLQCRVGKRNGVAAVKMAVDMGNEKLIKPEEAVLRVKADALVQCLLPMVDPKAERESKPLAKGLPAGPGGAHGMVVFTADEAARRGKELAREGHPRPHRDQPGRRPRHARRAGDPHRQGRHDQPRGAGRARLGQMLHRRLLRHRDGHGPQGPQGGRQGNPGRRLDHPQRHHRHGLRRQAAAGGPGPARTTRTSASS